MPSPSCAKQPRLGAIAGFSFNTRRWRGRPADFLCARLVFSMSCGKAAPALASFFTISCRRGVRASLAMPAHIPSYAYCASFMRVRTWPSSRFPSTRSRGFPRGMTRQSSFLSDPTSLNSIARSKTMTRCRRVDLRLPFLASRAAPKVSEEVADITYALKCVQSKGVRLRLIAIGRGTAVFEGELRKALDGSGIELSMLGLMPAEDLVQALASAQVLLCVRGHVSSRRGSAIAGIVCGVPIVGYRGAETGFPITEAGVKLVDLRDREGLVQALAQVLTDEKLYRELRQRSVTAAQQYFCWDAIASQFVSAMSGR